VSSLNSRPVPEGRSGAGAGAGAKAAGLAMVRICAAQFVLQLDFSIVHVARVASRFPC
jgi:hypothetical protein